MLKIMAIDLGNRVQCPFANKADERTLDPGWYFKVQNVHAWISSYLLDDPVGTYFAIFLKMNSTPTTENKIKVLLYDDIEHSVPIDYSKK